MLRRIRGEMRPALFAASLIGCVTVVAGCGGSGLPQGHADLRVHQLLRGSTRYIEGSISYVKLSASDGSSTEHRLDNRGRAEFGELAPGRYRIDSWQRPCNGNCGTLAGASDRCSRGVSVQAEAQLVATIILRPSHGCRIESP